MENTITEPLSTKARAQLALRYGAILGLIYMIISTGVNTTVNGMVIYFGLKILAYVLYMVMLGFFAAGIRKANGGYIELREVFGATFIMLLVAGLMLYFYYFFYMQYIDPNFMTKIKASTIAFYESKNVPDDKLDEIATKFDKQIAEAKNLDPNENILNFLGGLMLDCLFGLIVSLIVKKPRPIFL